MLNILNLELKKLSKTNFKKSEPHLKKKLVMAAQKLNENTNICFFPNNTKTKKHIKDIE